MGYSGEFASLEDSHSAHHAPLSVSARFLLHEVQQTVYVVSEDSKLINIKLKIEVTGQPLRHPKNGVEWKLLQINSEIIFNLFLMGVMPWVIWVFIQRN